MPVCQRFEPAGLPLREMSLFLNKTAKRRPVFAEAICECTFGPANGDEGTGHRVAIQRRSVPRWRHSPGQWVAQSTVQHPKGREPLEKIRVRNTLP